MKITNKEIKELLKNISEVMNEYEQYEIENGDAWKYIIKINKNKDIECRIYDGEWCEYVITIPNDVTDIKSILKGFINYLYENEINNRQSFVKGSDAFNRRKIKSLSNWSSKNNEAKCKAIQEELVSRFNIAKKVKGELEYYKVFVSRFYYALNTLVPNWKIEDIKEATFKRLDEFNIKNVGISYIDNKLIIMKSNDDSTYIVDKFDIEIDSYTNISLTVNKIVNRLRKVA
ncbi:hypothetical protein CLOBY_17950 [Clostridium saccharobutylicum]|uniref:hypothetical protein n=1 Tax=Clostridium saccharobutylicum TaxID=169679 RepID=UPI0009838D6C|nr:hypothetical protein [Clostridium saccharobutylicum]AQS09664.1 hypothetical protein CLOBY_17950 [Clostridium saccharobutylicum]MBC2436941.1 hypothetical protein [Clostridium saccharobutylicum]NSB89292.1 hypothetical protein [Clostridium saccharobutylicum]NYC27946.1 hypothetical protein [Clostridium saccharobutylicum]OOM17141.1 hypothetical protein CLSAB_20890 [Clostridium saccharobutylicum]